MPRELSIQKLRKQYKALRDEWEYLRPDWKKLADNFLPLQRVLLQENSAPKDVYQHIGRINELIIDDTPVKSMKVLGAGMQSGMTSPAKIWFKLGHVNSALEKDSAVKDWFEQVQSLMFDAMSRSNFYNSTSRCYLEVGIFGTLVMLILPDEEKKIRTITLPAGSYVLASNFKGEIDTLYRRLYMTADQMVDQFGLENVSQAVKNAYENKGEKTKWFSVVHACLPNPNSDSEKDDVFSMPYSSVYFEEMHQDNDEGNALSRSGFMEKPFVAARWDVTGEAVYGDSPCMDMLSFARGLQAMNATAQKAEQKNADPAMNVPPGMKNASTSPGVRNYQVNPNERITATSDIRPNTAGTLALIQDYRRQIIEGLFNDIFRALALSPTDRMTATEVLERVAEGLRLLGPVLERLQFEFLDPCIDRIFAILFRAGVFPEVPALLDGEDLKIEYISPLAQAQKAVGTDGITRLLGLMTGIAQINPEALDVVDWDALATTYADLINISPTIINNEDEVDAIREIRATQRAALLAAQQETQNIDNLKTMSETEVSEGENAIQAIEAAGAA